MWTRRDVKMVALSSTSFFHLVALATGAFAAPIRGGISGVLSRLLFPRADSFQCPVYESWKGARETCSGEEIIWNNKTTAGKYVTYYIPSSDRTVSRAGAARTKVAVDMIEGALEKGLAYYERWGAGIKVYLGIVGQYDAWGSASPLTDARENMEHCEVLIRFPGDREDPVVTLRTLKSTVHELYHCVQYAQNLKGRNSGTSEQRAWWMEGTARFFDGVMYPIATRVDAVLERGQFPEEYDPRISLVDQTYESALFYHYLHNVGTTPDQFNDWVATKTGRSTVAEDLADLEKTPLFADNWHGFAEAYVNNKVNYTATVPIKIVTPLSPFETRTLSGDVGSRVDTRSRSIGGFRFALGRYNLPPTTHYSVAWVEGLERRAVCTWRVARGEWQSVSESFDVIAGVAGTVEILCSCTKAAGCVSQFVFERKA
ncbi:hypothetical protein QBC34DRAFT_402640 [Podospora aff. communis PSN243]|uniref:Uncharacterized protein n=1 Tax=Podospora aff. communis PSN243 TaxID=3040156 RepID=A0AAV9GSS8_9PEZI|nr:hypothetical protein QBC34DRAFT_402640 [Podospora aff. communis PSN243]